MTARIGAIVLAGGVIIVAAVAARGAEPAEVKGIIKPAPDGPWFADSSTGERFTPFGLNYTPHGVQVRRRGATRENWIQFDVDIIDRDCAAMASAGVNVLRVFTSAASFVPDEGEVPDEALKKAEALVTIAGKHGIRVIIGGPDWWEGPTRLFPTGRFDRTGLYGEAQLAALEKFWRALAARFKGDPGVFAYSLRNEPMIPRQLPDEIWIDFLKRKYETPEAVGKAWGQEIASWADCKRPPDADHSDYAPLYDYQLAREYVAYNWARRQADAIRSVDPTHMVTNGGIQWDVPLFRHFPPSPYGYDGFDPHTFADLFDYTSIHWYDIRPDHMRNDADYRPLGLVYLDGFLTYCRVGDKPLVLEEFPQKVLSDEGYSKSFYKHVAGALIWEWTSVSTPDGTVRPNAKTLLSGAVAKLAARKPIDLSDATVWQIQKKRLLTWYADPGTFRVNPKWKARTGSDRWHDTGGWWVAQFGRMRKEVGDKPIRIDLVGEGPKFFAELYAKKVE